MMFIRTTGIIILNTYILLEIVTYAMVCFGLNTVFNPNLSTGNLQRSTNYVSGAIEFDAVNGYRITKCPFRYIRKYSSTVLFDNETCMNKQGFRSSTNFQTEKKARTKRVVVLGDSFTHMWYSPTPWPAVLQANYPGTEVYNMALAGTGIANWHSIYSNHVSKLDYDTLIIALVPHNLSRGFSIAETFHGDYIFGRFDSIPKDGADYRDNYRKQMKKIGVVISGEEAQKIVTENSLSFAWQPWKFYFLDGVIELLTGNIVLEFPNFNSYKETIRSLETPSQRSAGHLQYIENPEQVDAKLILEKYYGQKHARYFLEIIEDAKSRDTGVIIASIPLRTELINLTLNNKKTFEQTLLRHLASALEVEYFDGHSVFQDKTIEEIINRYWLPYDGHWSMEGSAVFAKDLARYMQEQEEHNGHQNEL